LSQLGILPMGRFIDLHSNTIFLISTAGWNSQSNNQPIPRNIAAIACHISYSIYPLSMHLPGSLNEVGCTCRRMQPTSKPRCRLLTSETSESQEGRCSIQGRRSRGKAGGRPRPVAGSGCPGLCTPSTRAGHAAASHELS